MQMRLVISSLWDIARSQVMTKVVINSQMTSNSDNLPRIKSWALRAPKDLSWNIINKSNNKLGINLKSIIILLDFQKTKAGILIKAPIQLTSRLTQ